MNSSGLECEVCVIHGFTLKFVKVCE